MTHVACFVAAALYSAYSTGTAPGRESHSGGGSTYTGANATGTAAATFPPDFTTADHAGANSSKIEDFALFATIATLSAVWVIAFVGLLLTMKREYRASFVSLQTGYAFSRNQFLDNGANAMARMMKDTSTSFTSMSGTGDRFASW
jgi:hypothetical protein